MMRPEATGRRRREFAVYPQSFLLAAGVLVSEHFFELSFELVPVDFDPPSPDFDPLSAEELEPVDSDGAGFLA
jgi:hypothetical protein